MLKINPEKMKGIRRSDSLEGEQSTTGLITDASILFDQFLKIDVC